MKRDHHAAVTVGRAVTQLNPSLSAGYKPYLSALGHLGRGQESDLVLRRLLTIEPDFTISRFLATTAMEKAGDRDQFVAGLRLAGAPD